MQVKIWHCTLRKGVKWKEDLCCVCTDSYDCQPNLFQFFCFHLRHNSIRRQLNLSNPDFNIQQVQKQEQLTGIGRIKPELYKQRSVDTDDGRRSNSKACGKLNFILKYDCDLEQLIVKIHKAINLPAKDFSGTSDPYVKIYLLPDRKTKHQTKVHRKTLNPVFDEVFLFSVPYNDLNARKLHFSVYDFDRFSRHDLIGQVVVDNFLDLADFPRECNIWKDIEYVTNVSTIFFVFLILRFWFYILDYNYNSLINLWMKILYSLFFLRFDLNPQKLTVHFQSSFLILWLY